MSIKRLDITGLRALSYTVRKLSSSVDNLKSDSKYGVIFVGMKFAFEISAILADLIDSDANKRCPPNELTDAVYGTLKLFSSAHGGVKEDE